MDLIRYLLGFIIRVAVGIVLLVIVWWLVTSLFPSLRIRNFVSFDGAGNMSFLPPPGSWKGLLQDRAEVPTGKEFVPTGEFKGYGLIPYQNYNWSKYSYITYTKDGVEIVDDSSDTNTLVRTTQGYATKELYVRNLSMYQGGPVYNGLAFGGEARETMFRDGKFPIIIADTSGRPIALSYALMTNAWAPSGWKRFETRITGSLPDKVSCLMIFESGNAGRDGSVIRTAIPVLCNYK